MKIKMILLLLIMVLITTACSGSDGIGTPVDTNNLPKSTDLAVTAVLYNADNIYDANLTSHMVVEYSKDGTDDIVKINLVNAENWTKLYLKVSYPVQFDFNGTKFGTLFQNSYFGSFPYEPGKVDVVIQMLGENPVGFTGSGEACRLTFTRRKGSSISSVHTTSAIGDLTSKIVKSLVSKTGTPNTVEWVEVLPADASLNHVVDFADFGSIGANYNKEISTNPTLEPSDANGKGKVDFADFGVVGQYYNNKISGYALYTGDPPTNEVKRYTYDGTGGTKIPNPIKSSSGWLQYSVPVDWSLDKKFKIVPLDSSENPLDSLGETIDMAGTSDEIVPIALPTVNNTMLFGSRPGIGIQPQDGSVHVVQNSSTKGFRHYTFDGDKSAWVAETITTDKITFPGVYCPEADKKSLLETIAMGYSSKESAFVYYIKSKDNGDVFGPMNKVVENVFNCDSFDYVYNPKDGTGLFVFAGLYQTTNGVFCFQVIPGDETPTVVGPDLIAKIDIGKVFYVNSVLEASGGLRVSYIAGTYDAKATPPTIDTKMFTTFLPAPLNGIWPVPAEVAMPSTEEKPINISTALHPNGFEDIMLTTAKPYTIPIVNISLLTSSIYGFNRTSDADTVTWSSELVKGGVSTEGFPLPNAVKLTLPGLTLTHAYPDSGNGGRFVGAEYDLKSPVTWSGLDPTIGDPEITSFLANYRYNSSAWSSDTNITDNSTISPSIAYNPVWKKFCLVYINAALNPQDPLANGSDIDGQLIYKTLDP